ncbi:NAD-dependent epimerase/dehydratase family protein [Renibacterium salmoninarum]|uniref:NAD-dependent epimerase/dehydratase family protein n=1 Tax=Renibacterium salmoninarum TaxID=1646 RepID=UPI0018F75D94|nr:NAD-dependent epimerase/dehydratase family protein [Renibacterium salmoninarum]
MAEKVVVTGGTGYVASWCIVELLNRGYEVRTTVRSAVKSAAVVQRVSSAADPAKLSFAEADLTVDAGWDGAMAGIDYVLHVVSPLGDQRSQDAEALIVSARDGALRVIGAALRHNVKRVVMTSAANAASPSSYAEEGVTDETLWTNTEDPKLIPYRKSKTVAELAAWEYARAGSRGQASNHPARCGLWPNPGRRPRGYGGNHRSNDSRKASWCAAHRPGSRRCARSGEYPYSGHERPRSCW